MSLTIWVPKRDIVIPHPDIYIPDVRKKHAAVTLVTTGTVRNVTASPGTAGYTLVASPNLVAVAPIAYNGAVGMSVTSCSLGGVNFTRSGTISHNTTNHGHAEIWYLVNPPTGAQTFKVNVASTITDIYFNLLGVANVSRTSPVRPGTYFADTVNGSTGASGYTAVITSTVGDLTITCTNGGNAGNVTTNQTLDSQDLGGTYSMGQDHGTGASTVSHIWTGGGSGAPVALVGFSLMQQGNNLLVIENVNFTKKRSYFF